MIKNLIHRYRMRTSPNYRLKQGLVTFEFGARVHSVFNPSSQAPQASSDEFTDDSRVIPHPTKNKALSDDPSESDKS